MFHSAPSYQSFLSIISHRSTLLYFLHLQITQPDIVQMSIARITLHRSRDATAQRLMWHLPACSLRKRSRGPTVPSATLDLDDFLGG